jgi:hypothetical protein
VPPTPVHVTLTAGGAGALLSVGSQLGGGGGGGGAGGGGADGGSGEGGCSGGSRDSTRL